MLSIGQGLVTIPLSLAYRMPISIAWSTPGAAVLVAARGITGDFGAAVGAFIVSGLLIVIAGLWPWLANAVTRIPRSIASAMLAGILFPICLSPVLAAVQLPLAAIPPILVWLILFRLARRWAVPAAMLATVVSVGALAGTDWLGDAVVWPQISLVLPAFDPFVIVGLGIPLFIVTMAGQNVPGLTVLRTFGYDRPPTRAILVSTGAASVAGAFGGAHALNLAAITAAIMRRPRRASRPRPAVDRDLHRRHRLRRARTRCRGGDGSGGGVTSHPHRVRGRARGARSARDLHLERLEDEDGRIVAILTFLVVASGSRSAASARRSGASSSGDCCTSGCAGDRAGSRIRPRRDARGAPRRPAGRRGCR